MPATPSTKPMATQPDAAQEYICDLQEQLDEAKLDLESACASYDALLSSYDNTVKWYEQLQVYCDAIDKTNLCAKTMINLLNNAINQSNLVGSNACYAVDAIRYLVRDLETVSKCTEAVKTKLVWLINQFPPLDANDPIKKAYQALLDKLNEAMKCITEALLQLLQTLQSLEVLWKGIFSSDSNGLAGYLGMMLNTFKTGTPHTDYEACPHAACAEIKFPLDETQNQYYQATMADCDSVYGQLYAEGGLKEQLEDAEREKNAKQNCYDALKAALDAANGSRACKK